MTGPIVITALIVFCCAPQFWLGCFDAVVVRARKLVRR